MQEFKAGDRVFIEGEFLGKEDLCLHSYAEFENLKFMPIQVYKIPPKTYEDGLVDAWEVARKIAYYDDSDPDALADGKLEEIFGTDDERHILMFYTAEEAIAKIKVWKDENDIRVGDVVTINITGEKGVVTRIYNECYSILYEDGSIYIQERTDIKKTGRQIDIAGLLAQIGGGTDEV